jgi:hypothetical protein
MAERIDSLPGLPFRPLTKGELGTGVSAPV